MGDLKGGELPIRPPWSLDEIAFDESCTNCGDCITACPQSILSFARGRLPIVNFDLGECTFCGKCELVCQANALDKSKIIKAWPLKAMISDECFARKKITCRSCEDQCEANAIHFKLGLAGMATPQIQIDQCTGCGACFAPCPANAISINHNN